MLKPLVVTESYINIPIYWYYFLGSAILLKEVCSIRWDAVSGGLWSLVQLYRERSSLFYHMRFHHTTKPRSIHFHALTRSYQFSILDSRFSILDYRLSIIDYRFSILNSQVSILKSQISSLKSSDEYTPFGSGNMLRMPATAHFGYLMWPSRPIERMDARKRYDE
jgi:hypothetical protein